MLKGKKIILAVTGSIAAYKTPSLVRLLVKAGAEVKVIMTTAAAGFVTPLALSTVSKHPVYTDISNGENWNNHVALGLWADAMIVAPCSANTLSKMAHGLCDNLVLAVYLSARCPVFVAPAMDEDMWHHPATRQNIDKLTSFGCKMIPVGNGELASGLVGEGRMAEPEQIVQHLEAFWTAKKPLAGMHALVTAGPTYEKIDPVRFIGNFSTGKMGFALAEALDELGAEVILVTGPTRETVSNKNITVLAVESAEEMYAACVQVFPACEISILSAAVADYRPQKQAKEKIKKAGAGLTLDLVPTKDILLQLGKIKSSKQTLTGFALETQNEFENAHKKLINKNADIIVLNSLRDPGSGFGHDTNKITIINKNGDTESLPLLSKREAAFAIINHIVNFRNAK